MVVNCDLPWNPARLEQRIARAWRKFQTRPVTVINLISEDTIEHRMLETLDTKRTLADSVLDSPGKVTSVVLRKSRKDAAEALRKLTAHDPAEPAPSTPRTPRDLTREFAIRIQQRLGTQLVACEERQPTGGGPGQLLVVVEHVAQARTPWMDSLQEEFFPPIDGGAPTHQIEILDRPTHETIERLVRSGLLQRTDVARSDLLATDSIRVELPPLSEAELAAIRDANARAERTLRRARVLGEAEFSEEATASLRESLLPLLTARALQSRRSPPLAEPDLLTAPSQTLWGELWPVVETLLTGTVTDWRSAHAALSAWMQGKE